MILILSEEVDISTDNVVEWLRFYDSDFTRLNSESCIPPDEMMLSNDMVSLPLQEMNLNLADVKSAWFRRGFIRYKYEFDQKSNRSIGIRHSILRHLYNEGQTYAQFIYRFLLANSYSIGAPTHYNLNKLEILFLAASFGLLIPTTLVCTNSAALEKIGNDHELITKAAFDNVSFKDEEKSFGAGTCGVTDLPDTFFPSVFQVRINRFCEIRIFFIEETFYPMAVFVDKELHDGRELVFNNEKARLVPFLLPQEISEKLLKLIKAAAVNTGSIDMIWGEDKKFYFLEINPVGQYEYLEHSCNYPISKDIASRLINHGKILH